MENTLQLKRVGDLDVFFRNPNIPIQDSNQAKELEKMVNFLTDEDFEDYYDEELKKNKRRLKNPKNFEILTMYRNDNIQKHICLCSEDSCAYLVIVKHKPTDLYMALGSSCYKRFDEENGAEIYYHCEAKRCNDCNTPLVFKKTSKFLKNTDKICNNSCFGCFKKKKDEVINQ